MEGLFKINIFNVINSPFCVDPEDGRKVYSLIKDALEKGVRVQLSLDKITMVITAFLNEAIGVLYKDFSAETIDQIKFIDISDELKESFDASLTKVKLGAPIYYKHQSELNNATKHILEEE